MKLHLPPLPLLLSLSSVAWGQATPGDPGPVGIELEGLDGSRRQELLEEPLTDPREHGAWIVRPVPTGGSAARAEARSADSAAPRAEVTLTGGDRVLGEVIGGRGEELALEWTAGEVLRLDATRIRSLVLRERIPARWNQPVEPAPKSDRLYVLAAGGTLDLVDGTLEEFTLEGVRFDGVLGSKLFPWNEVVALFLEDLGGDAAAKEQPGVPVVLDLLDGSRIGARLLALERGGVRLRLPGDEGGDGHLLAWARLSQLLVADGRLVFLSDLPVVAETGMGSPFLDDSGDVLGMTWPHRMDRSVDGGPLRVGGTTHERGIGSHAPTRITWQLDGSFEVLRGAVGIDDAVLANPAWARGEATCRVVGDGRVLWESRLLRGGDPPVALPPISVEGVHELVLEAEAGADFAGDRVDWLALVLSR